MSALGFIGTGDMAAPMVRYLARKGHDIWVSERSEELSTQLANDFETVTRAANQEVVDNADIVFLCLRPQVWQAPTDALNFRADQQVVSVMSGPTLTELDRACAPASSISMVIPMAAMEHGGCPLPVFPATGPIQELFGGDNPVLPLNSEADIAKHFVASTMLSAVFGLMHDGAGWLGAQTGNADGAETYVTALVNAMLRDVPHGAGHLLQARDALATPGTLNLSMVEGLAKGDVTQALHASMDAILKRLQT
jgi:pyrroline-5-carboxylate reductase